MTNSTFSKVWIQIVLMVLIGGGFFAWQYFGGSKEEANEGTAAFSSEVLTTEDWQTYRNEKYGFEFSYPEGWAAIESVSPGYPYLVFVSLGRQETIQEGGLFWVVIRDQTEDAYLSSLAEGEFYIISRTDSSLGDKKATTYIYGRTTGSPGIQWKAIVAQKNGLLLEFSKGATLGSDDIFNQILSTFRFKDECVISGCSGEICSDEGVLTTCLYLPHYECYKEAVCERQPDGQCGWTTTETLKQCLEDKRATFRFIE
jgi:eight-cysteine-cluster-containing protein